jgi:FtsH-binding integral membrane protein
MLGLWLWMMIAFWIYLARSTKAASERGDTNVYGILLGTLAALTGFLASSLVNYNYGDSEVAMLFWYSMGVATAIAGSKSQIEIVNRNRVND